MSLIKSKACDVDWARIVKGKAKELLEDVARQMSFLSQHASDGGDLPASTIAQNIKSKIEALARSV